MPESSAVAEKPPISPWAPLRVKFFRMLWIASFVSNIGTWMQNVGAVWLMTHLTTSTVLVALMQTASALPVFLLSLPAGALADLVDRRRFLLFTQAWMGVVAMLLAAVTLLGHISPWGLLFLTFLLDIGGALNNPVWRATTPELVPRPLLPGAITLNSISFNLARALGPALGGLVVAYSSPGLAFLLNGLSFLATIYMVYTWKRENQGLSFSGLDGERILSALRGGVRYARFSPPVQNILVRAFAYTFGASIVFALLSPVVDKMLHLGGGVYSALLSCMGGGAVVTALLLPRLNRAFGIDSRVNLAAVLFAVVSLGLAFAPHVPLWSLYVLLTIGGAAWMMSQNSFNVAIQTVVPNWVQARILGVYIFVFQGGMALGSATWGAVADEFGLPVALLASAAWMLLTLLLVFRFSLRNGENLDFTIAQHWAEPTILYEPREKDGPVLVTITYCIAPEDRPGFTAVMRKLSRIRRREGAMRVGLYADLADPERMVEYFVVDSWAEHEEQHERGLGAEEADLLSQARKFHQGAEIPKVTHLIAQSYSPPPPAIMNTPTEALP
ncbi:MFS transporter [Hymenobacter sp. GOD-10R]|uniref:MFS transporter n=1 Tax=Hymenobacter sp. GOD-10R TaxID=3093922 RepID=UPI002D768D25|nr:MFS transporter [Hymenobacter sp. GOD-10R]WRQ30573.1 MFS transporter [Hymenobacter sp. GOD-10R]